MASKSRKSRCKPGHNTEVSNRAATSLGLSRVAVRAMALGDSAARLAQLLLDRVGVVVAIDVDCGRGQRVVLTLAARLAIGQHIVEQQPMPIADSFGGQHVVVNQPNDGRATQPRRSAACWVVSVMDCGAIVTALPAYSAATTFVSAW